MLISFPDDSKRKHIEILDSPKTILLSNIKDGVLANENLLNVYRVQKRRTMKNNESDER